VLLQALADAFNAKRKAGLVQGHGSGYGGSGYKFDKEEDAQVKAARKSKAKVWPRGRQHGYLKVLLAWQCGVIVCVAPPRCLETVPV